MTTFIISGLCVLLFGIVFFFAQKFGTDDGIPSAETYERDTLPPDADLRDPADLLASVAVRMERTAESLALVSRELAMVAREIAIVRQQQQTHGTAIAQLQNACVRLERRVGELESINDGRGYVSGRATEKY